LPKRDLIFPKPLMNGAGMLGFTPDGRAPVPWAALGAFITNPISLRARRAATAPEVVEYPGGFLLHTGLPNPGFHAVVKRSAHRWQEAPLPVIPHLMADRPDETRQMVQALESVDNVMAVELGFAPLLAPDIILLAVEMCRGELPLIASLPAEQVLELGGRVLETGAAALSLAAPRGALERDGNLVQGRLFGPALLPRSLDVVYSAARLGLPIIAAGGVSSEDDARTLLRAGAVAVQVDYRLWLAEQ
jgi:dihydroorotate dehydrogenase (NAD+) catalytic subunit